MEHKAPYALVGLFVCLCVATLVGFVIWMQGDAQRNSVNYTVMFPESVSGLEQGAQVMYRGVRVGKVEDLRLPPGGDSYIRVDIRIRNDVPVRDSTKAELSRTSLAGIVNLNINAPKDGDTESAPRIAGEKYPVIEGQKSALETALKDVPAITRDLRNLTGKANQSIDDFRGSFVGKLMGQKTPEQKRRDALKKQIPQTPPQYQK